MLSELREYEDKMKRTLDFLAQQFATVRAGRANADRKSVV